MCVCSPETGRTLQYGPAMTKHVMSTNVSAVATLFKGMASPHWPGRSKSARLKIKSSFRSEAPGRQVRAAPPCDDSHLNHVKAKGKVSYVCMCTAEWVPSIYIYVSTHIHRYAAIDNTVIHAHVLSWMEKYPMHNVQLQCGVINYALCAHVRYIC